MFWLTFVFQNDVHLDTASSCSIPGLESSVKEEEKEVQNAVLNEDISSQIETEIEVSWEFLLLQHFHISHGAQQNNYGFLVFFSTEKEGKKSMPLFCIQSDES